MTSLPMYFPNDFSIDTALTCADLVNVAYDQANQWYEQDYPDPGSFKWTPLLSQYTYSVPLNWTYTIAEIEYVEPMGFVAVDSNSNGYVVFRGTVFDIDGVYDGKTDLTPYALVSGYGSVHLGFYEIYTSLNRQLASALSSMNASNPFTTLIFTGHSLGCGLSTLALPDVFTNTDFSPSSSLTLVHYNLASPRVGDPTFADQLNGSSPVTYRVVNTEDIVPDAPTAVFGSELYKHVGIPVDFTANYGTDVGNHSLVNCYLYALKNPTDPENQPSAVKPRMVRFESRIHLPAVVPATS